MKMISRITCIIFILSSSCNTASNIHDTCLENPTDKRCIDLVGKYHALRNTPVLSTSTRNEISEKFDNLGLQFSMVALEAKELSPCISLSSQSYADYMNALVLGSKNKTEFKNVYPKKPSSIKNNLLRNCPWDHGESSMILADYILSKRYTVSDAENLRKFVFSLNRSQIDENFACSLMFNQLHRAIPRLSKKPSEHEKVILEASVKCHHDYSKIFGDYIIPGTWEFIENNFMALDRELSGIDREFDREKSKR